MIFNRQRFRDEMNRPSCRAKSRIAPSSDGSTFARYILEQLSANAGAPTAVPSHEPATLMMAAIE